MEIYYEWREVVGEKLVRIPAAGATFTISLPFRSEESAVQAMCDFAETVSHNLFPYTLLKVYKV